jgi:hypothetical protein
MDLPETVAPPVETAPAPAPVTEPFSVPSWGKVSDINDSITAGKVPAEVVPWLRAASATMAPLEGRVQAAEAEYSQAKEKFLAAAAQMESQPGGQGTKLIAENHAKLIDNVESMTSELVDTALVLFDVRHPEYKSLPDTHPMKVYLGKMWADGTADRVFKGNYSDKMEEAYKFACFQTKYSPEAAAAPAPAKPANPEAARQLLMNNGSHSTSRPINNLDETTVSELLSRNDHLLPGT